LVEKDYPKSRFGRSKPWTTLGTRDRESLRANFSDKKMLPVPQGAWGNPRRTDDGGGRGGERKKKKKATIKKLWTVRLGGRGGRKGGRRRGGEGRAVKQGPL